jgi:hypothetical protein
MRRLLLAVLAIGLLSSTTLANEEWTEEETNAGVKKMEFVRYAFAGVTMKLQYLYALDLDCSTFDGYEYEITKRPEHGTAEIVTQTFFPMYPKGNPRFRCNENKVDGFMLTYTPKVGYKGPDSLTYTMIGPSGLAWEKTYNFNVRSAPATASGPKKRDS